MKEEKVTLAIIGWLKDNGWEIICFDFPQSGTGYVLQPNAEIRKNEKNKGSIIPDIVAVKGKLCLFFENKDRFVLSDFQKINNISNQKDYSESIEKLLKNHPTDKVIFGIGLPYNEKSLIKITEHKDLVDFVVAVHEDLVTISIIYEKEKTISELLEKN